MSSGVVSRVLFLVMAVGAGTVWLATSSSGEKAASAVPDLAGRFRLDKEASDDARAKLREVTEKRGGPSGGRPMGPPGGGGPAAAGGPSGDGKGGPGAPGVAPGDDGREAMRAVFEPAEELVIVQSDAELTIDERFGRTRRLHPDGRKYKTDNGAAEVKSYWKAGRLVVETRSARGASVVETWERASDGSRLTVLVRLEGGPGGKLELKRVYDRIEAGAPDTPR